MQYGLHLPNFGPYGDPRVLADLARDAERAGWDGFFIWDHLAKWHTLMADPWVALAAVAMNTARIRIGTMVTPLPRRRPWKLARETMTLEHLSNGRLILGVGSGPGGEEFEGFGEFTDARTRAAMLDEGLAVLTGLWSGEPLTFTGEHYTVDNIRFEPRAIQQPRIPVWVGGIWPHKAPLRRAARWDGAFPIIPDPGDTHLVQVREAVEFIRAERAKQENAGSPFDIVINGDTWGQSPDEAAATVNAFAAAGVTWWLERLSPEIEGGAYRDPEWPLEAMRARVLQGPPRG
jgi:alkanesulfonate monooxygenase SsuD/methylene tetrahydromethanopterin reductase-like flavin-dependent oxidoreductase (luciferase family)